MISKKGEATAVILSVEDYLRNIVKQPEALTKLQEQAKKAGKNKLTLEDSDAEIKALTLQLHKNYMKREVGVLERLYSGTFKRFATEFPSISQRSPQVTSYVPHKT